jgi:luciferase family oxidoreductase group 1
LSIPLQIAEVQRPNPELDREIGRSNVGTDPARGGLWSVVHDPLGVPVSVLDVAPVSSGSTPGDALRASIALAQLTESLGYHRLWVAEHHNMPGIASSAPAVLLAHVASATQRIRVGSGGVMLPNHAPLVIAEQFGMLDALHPGRVDLGIGRAPGTDQVTAYALRRSVDALSAKDFPQHLLELMGFFSGDFAEDHPFRAVQATPGRGQSPDIWLLGSSDFSARLAGALGLPFSFAHHFSAPATMPALEAYRREFRPSERREKPQVMLAVNVVCAETDAEANRLATSQDLAFLLLRSNQRGLLQSPEEAAAFPYTAADLAQIQARRVDQFVGTPEHVRARLDALLAQTQADELMVMTMVHDPQARRRSYELLAEALGVAAL